ncbi:DUF3089 domain-containing protein [Patulibacter defluvii]|uniref:DUF3089 domain-containing protein n=1 Tax=Patulibacter defluvii TaxID=3095358 RepID=UPI002A753B7F|nr:DUF3089 domain-containing protein [Patulibacter sp. DM4]
MGARGGIGLGRPRRLAAIAIAVLAVAVGLGAGASAAPAAAADVAWLCRPDRSPDPCREPLTTTIQEPDGGTRVVDPPLPANPPIDCFYVYPTVSNQLTPLATATREPEVDAIARLQAQRFSSVCRVFAPLYRQATILSIFASPITRPDRELGYGDVRAAWRQYLARDNHGRGVVLIGHSQGTGVLRRLIHDEIDPVPAVRSKLVSAILLGGNVLTRRGSDRGGDFQRIPICTRDGQAGCVIAYSIFNAPPPDGSAFGRAPSGEDRISGLPGGAEYEVACTNPASLGANADRPFETLMPTAQYPLGLIALDLVALYLGGRPPSAPTPWVQPADRYRGRCERVGGAHVLMIRSIGSAPHLNPAPEPGWGLHIVDGNLPLGDLVRAVAAQTRTYLAPAAAPPAAAPAPVRVGLRLRYRRARDARDRRCARPPLRATLTGGDRRLVRRAAFRVDRRAAGEDRRAPFAAAVARDRLRPGRVARVDVRVTLADGRARRVGRSVRICG